MKRFQQIFSFSEMIKYILFLGGGFPVYNNPRPNPGCQVLTMRLQKIINTGCKTKIHPMSGNQLGSRWTWGPTWTSCFSRSNPVSCFPGPNFFCSGPKLFFSRSKSNSFFLFSKKCFFPGPTRRGSLQLWQFLVTLLFSFLFLLAKPGHPSGRSVQHRSHLLDWKGHGVQADRARGGEYCPKISLTFKTQLVKLLKCL